MADFDFNAYLDKKLSEPDFQSKIERVTGSSEDKKARLARINQETEAQRNSWAGKLGLQADGFLGGRVNDVASLVSGASRVAGHIASLPANALGFVQDEVLAGDLDPQTAEYVRQGKATPAEMREAARIQQLRQGGQQLRDAGRATNNFFDLSGIVDQTNRNQLTADLGDEFESNWSRVTSGWKDGKPTEVVSGLASLLMNAGEAAVTNPGASKEYILENLPQLFVGAAGKVGGLALGASNVGYAADEYQKGIDNYKAANGGEMPAEDVRQRMALMAASLAVAEQFGDKAMLGMGKVAKALRTAPVEAGEDTARAGFLKAMSNTLKAGAAGTATEAATEGYQTYAEGEVEGKPASAQDIYTGAAIGGIAGGGLTGGSRAVAEMIGTTPEKIEREIQQTIKAAEESKLVKEATQAADPDVFLKDGKNYNPAKAISVLMGMAEQEGTTADQFKNYLNRASDVVDNLEKRAGSVGKVDTSAMQEDIDFLKEEIANTDPADTDGLAFLNEELASAQEKLAQAQNSSKLATKNEQTVISRQLKEAKAQLDAFARISAPAPTVAEVQTTVADTASPDVEVATKAADTLISLSMTAFDDVKPDVALRIAEDTTNNLNEDQRSYLRKFAEARVAENALKDMKKVSQEVLFGSPGKYVGIAEYRTRIGQAVSMGNETRAQAQLAGLKTFMDSHNAKLKLAETAPWKSQIVRNEATKSWEINTGPRLSDAALKKNGGFNLNSETLVDGIRAEAKALTLAHGQLSDAVALRFGKAPVQSEPSTPAAPKTDAAPPVSPASLFREKREREVRKEDGETEVSPSPSQNVVKTPQTEQVKKEISKPVSQPQSQPSVPVAAKAAPDTAAPSAVTTPEVKPEAAQQPDEAQAESPAAEAATAEEQKQKPNREEGRLSILASRKEGDTRSAQEQFEDETTNVVATFFDQASTDEGFKSHRPLVRVKDFLSKMTDNLNNAYQMLPKDLDVEASSVDRVLNDFIQKATFWNKTIRKNIGKFPDKKRREFMFEDMMQFFVTRNGEEVVIDENLLTGISAGAYMWAKDTASADRMTKERINAMFGRDPESSVNPAIWDTIAGMHGFEATTINDIGGTIIQALGLKERPNAPQNMLPRLKVALGVHALLALEKSKLVKRVPIRHEDIVEHLEEKQGERISGDVMMFVFPDYERLAQFKEANAGTQSLIEKLFTAQEGDTFASTKPTPFKQEFAKHTRQKVTPEQTRALDAMHKTPHTVITEMFEALKGLGIERFLKVAGFADLNTVHAANQRGAEAQNKNLDNQLMLMLENLGITNIYAKDADDKIKQPLFIRGEVWKNFRAGILTRGLNPQTSKIHRYMFARPDWTATVDLDKQEQHDDLIIAFAAGLGMKTDDQPNEQTIALFNDFIQKPKVRAAIDAMKDGLNGVWDGADAIADFAAGAEGMMTLQTLTQIAKYELADRKGKLDITMLVGADGKTNGPILTHLALGAAGTVGGLLGMMERGGMFKEGRGQHFSDARKNRKLKDLYEDLASRLVANIPANPLLASIEVITGQLTKDGAATSKARGIVKTPLTAFAFGSTVENSVKSMANKFVSDLYAKIEEIHAMPEKKPEQQQAKEQARKDFVAAVNALLSAGSKNVELTPEDVSFDELLTISLTPKETKAIIKAFTDVMGDPVQKTMSEYFAVFIQRRSDLNRTLNTAYSVYEAAYASARERKIEQLMNEGKLASFKNKDGKLSPIYDLTSAQEAELQEELRDLQPVAHTAFSLLHNDLAYGVFMGKTDAELTDNTLYQSQVNTVDPVQMATFNPEQARNTHVKAKPMVRIETKPGVAGTPYFIHSLDAANMHLALLDLNQSMNVHDEIGNSVLNIKRAAGAINRATYQNLLKFSPAREALSMMERLVVNMNAAAKDGKVDPSHVASMFKSWQNAMFAREKEIYGDDVDIKYPSIEEAIPYVIKMAVENAVQADEMRLGTVGRLAYVDQYVWEGGQYQVAPSERAQAEQLYKDMKRDMSEEAQQSIWQLVSFMKKGKVAEPKVAPDVAQDKQPMPQSLPTSGAAAAAITGKPVDMESVKAASPAERAQTVQALAEGTQALAGTGITPWGRMGLPTQLDIPVRDAFKAKPVMNRNEVVRMLDAAMVSLKKPEGYREILRAVAKALPENLRVEMVTPETDTKLLETREHDNSRGWYAPKTDGGNTIYVMSDAFIHTGMSVETVLHELVHAATVRAMLSTKDASVKSIIKDLTNLVEHLRQQEGASKYAHILKGDKAIFELVAWGMSNQDFQKWMSTIPFESRTTTNRITNAFKEFVRILTGGAYRGTALEALLRNSAGLMSLSNDANPQLDMRFSQVAAPESMNAMDIYEALGQDTTHPLDEATDARLRSLMQSMALKLHPITGIFGNDINTKILTDRSVMAGAPAPFANDAHAAGLVSNEQAAFVLEQVEVTVREAISGGDGQVSLAYRELAKLYTEAREVLKGKLDQATYDFLFKLDQGSNDRSDYLSRFAALGLVNPEINAALGFATAQVDRKRASNSAERLLRIWESILEWVTGKWTGTQAGQNADTKLEALASQLVLIEAKRRARLNVARNRSMEAIEEAFSGAATTARDKVAAALQSDMVKNAKSGYVRAIGSVGSLAVKDRLDWLGNAFQTFSDTHFKESQGTMAGLVDELRGTRDDNVVFRKLLNITKWLETQRKRLISQTTRVALESFANGGKDLTQAQKKAISAVFLRTDLAALIDKHGIKGVYELVNNRHALKKTIESLEASLKGHPFEFDMLNGAENLGWFLANGEAGNENTRLNAYAIARLHGTDRVGKITEEEAAKVEPVVDELASLWALQFTSVSLLKDALVVFDKENEREEGHGVEMILKLHKKMQQDSKERLFKDQEALMKKGYLPEVYNHYVELKIASKDERVDMRAQGYGQGMKLTTDEHDTVNGPSMMLYARHGTGLIPYNSGAFSTTAMKTQGTVKHDGNLDLFSEIGQGNVDMMDRIARAKAGAIKRQSRQRVHAGSTNKKFMVPVLNPSGETVNYRYMMTNAVKDAVLERDNRFEHLLGAMAGSIYDKTTAPKQNRSLVEALKKQYDLEIKDRAVSYVEVGPRSPDPLNRERYRLLPEETKMAIREVWQSDSMWVRRDLLDINFGYRKKSIVDTLATDREAREGMQKFLGELLGWAGGMKVGYDERDYKLRDDKAIRRLRNVEEIWQTFVREAKDMIVIKSGSTLMGNVMSNFTLLYAYGVPLTDMMRSHRIALRGALNYKKDQEELFRLETALATETASDVAGTKTRIVQLKDAIARNPVRQLIEAGLMPTIVEDVEIDDDIYSPKSKFVKRVEGLTSKINPHVLNVGKTLYMTHDTKAYKFLSQGATMSDFLARYTLYQHMTTKKNPMSSEDALQLASDAFINYDVPTHRNIQYVNDMGLIRFTKYYLRIQKVILHLYKEQPARMLMLMAASGYLNTLPTIIDSAMFTRFGNNPLEWGPLEYLLSFDDLLSVKTVMAPF